MIIADLIVKNANILTLDETNSRGRSLAAKNGCIIGIWQDPEPPKDAIHDNSETEIIDLSGKTILPGFIDTHNHLLMYSLFRKQVNCSTPPNKTIRDILASIQDKLDNSPEEEWILGWGYDNTLLEENRHPNRHELDAISPNKPVFIRHISAHFAVANSVALKLAGIDEHTPDPKGGHLGRDNTGKLDGVLHELPALELIQSIIPTPTTEEIASYIGEASVDYLQQGITTSTDAGVGLDYGIKEFDAHLKAVKGNKNPINMRFMILHHLLNEEGPFANYSAKELDTEIREKSNHRACLDSAKLFQDGSIQGLTGALRQPYYNAPDVVGELLHDQESFNEEVLDLHERGYRIATHGNGDHAIDSIINAYHHALETHPRQGHLHRIEHVQTATNDDLDRMKKSGIVASFFINHVYYWGDRHYRLFLGPERAMRMNPLKDAEKRDILFTLHSDCPITPISPLFSIWAAVNRITREGHVLGADQAISVETALRTMTIDGAKLNFQESDVGSIEISKRADLIILDADPTAIDPMEIKDIEIMTTIINGKTVYKKEE